MRVHVLQHVAFENLGSIGTWLHARGADVRHTRFFAGDRLPSVDGLDLVVAMGGPMSVNDEAEWPWLRAEKQFVRDAIARDIPVLGVCLGAQLIASALGARVYRNPEKEIGWFPIRSVETDAPVVRLPDEMTVMHWHGETFDLPPGAVRLASSPACLNQAFQVKENVLGLQFHLEMTAESVGAMLDHCGHEVAPARYVQSAQELRAVPASRYDVGNALMDALLESLVGAETGARSEQASLSR